MDARAWHGAGTFRRPASTSAWWDDDQYLFRQASTFGWDTAKHTCDALISGIEQAAASSTLSDGESSDAEVDGYDYFNDSLGHRDSDEKSLQEWLGKASAQLFYADQWGNSPLHAASYVKPPSDVIMALFRVGRALWEHGGWFRDGETPVWAVTCKDGSTPFLVAASTGASTSVLHAYLDEIEYYIQRKWVHPRHSRMLVVQPDNQGTTPLVGWMNFHYSWIKRQLEKETPGVNNSNRHLIGHHHFPRRTEELSLPDYWNFACRILLFATMNIRPHKPPSTPVLVHRIAAISLYSPVSLLEWIVAYRRDDDGWAPGDASAASKDSMGKLPMHRALEAVDSSSMFDEDIVHHSSDFDGIEGSDIATEPLKSSSATVLASEPVCPRAEAIIYNNPKLEQNRSEIVAKLLKWHPQAAKAPFANGRPPLVQAIAFGGTWHGSNPDNDYRGLLQSLWERAPEQSLEVDPMTGLYPFMLAATVPIAERNMDEKKTHVDTVYNLLRKDPQLVSGALS